MRKLEYFHGLRVLPAAWTIIRVDGRGFSRFTQTHFEKPFDSRFHELMTATASHLLQELQGVYAYTQSDEISVLLPRDNDLFDRELEKLVSVSAGIVSASFTHAFGKSPAHFDSRICVAANSELVLDYFRWRQSDCTRCALNGWCYWTLRNAGQSVTQATKALQGLSVALKNELLFQHGTNFNDVPSWQRRGSGIYWLSYEKSGVNRKTGESVQATRRRIKVDDALPLGEGYAEMIHSIMTAERDRK
jgi:tRNA(His) guanylyltransferase